MDLACCEPTENEITACVDKTLLREDVLQKMLEAEDRCTPKWHYNIRQEEVTNDMIEIVADWMMEVCEEQNCQIEVFLLSMNYMFRFLRMVCIKKNQLQCLGAACMLLASKLREPKPLSVDILVFYTDHSIKRDMLTRWELLVLNKLKWDIVAIVPVDFLPHLLSRLSAKSCEMSNAMVKNHAKTLITLCAKECQFAHYHPSVIACASIVSSLCGLGWENKAQGTLSDLLWELQQITHVETAIVRECVVEIDEMIRRNVKEVSKTQEKRGSPDRTDQVTPPPMKSCEIPSATTPTDVHDIEF